MKKIIKKQIKFFGKKKLVLGYIKKQNTKNFKIKYYNELYKFFSLINHMKNVWVIKLKLKTYMKKNWRIKDNWYRKYLKKLSLENQK